MNRVRKAAGVFILSFGLIASAMAGSSHADTNYIDIPYGAKFTYRLTSANQWIRPGTVPIRFSRTDTDPFCSKMVEVGVNTGSKNYPPGVGPAPGTVVDPASVLYASPISGAPLCSFNLNDDVVNLAVPPWKEEEFRQAASAVIKEFPCPDPGAADVPSPARRYTRVEHGFVSFKTYYRKNGGAYVWTNPVAHATAPGMSPAYLDRIPVDLVYEAVPNRPPALESVTLSPGSLPTSGGTVKITVVANDDVGVRRVSIVRCEYCPQFNISGNPAGVKVSLQRTAGLGRTAGGDNRSQWEGTFTVPPNIYCCKPQTITASITLEDGERGITVVDCNKIKVVPVQQAKAPDTTPPQISQPAVTPQTLPAAGGKVKFSVFVKDACGVDNVRITLVRSDGWSTQWQATLKDRGTLRDGEWISEWNMWANTGKDELVYKLTATAMDTNGLITSTQPFAITVAGKTPPSSQPSFEKKQKPEKPASSGTITPGKPMRTFEPPAPPLR